MKNSTIFAFILIISTNIFALGKREKVSDFKKDKILIDAWLDKEEYLVGEDVTINIRFINNTDKKYLLPDPRNLSSFYRDLRDSGGCELSDRFSGFYKGPEIISIVPYDTIEINTHINEPYKFNKSYKTADDTVIYIDIPANKYIYHMEYSNGRKLKPGDNDLWKKTMSFTINEPTGPDCEAYQLYLKANRYLFPMYLIPPKGEPNKKTGLELLDSLIENYPNSVYVPLAISAKIEALTLKSNFYVHHTETEIKLCKYLMEKYPNFRPGEYLGLIHNWSYYKKGKMEEYKVYLEDLMLNTSSIKLKKAIKSFLKSNVFKDPDGKDKK